MEVKEGRVGEALKVAQACRDDDIRNCETMFQSSMRHFTSLRRPHNGGKVPFLFESFIVAAKREIRSMRLLVLKQTSHIWNLK
jgi:hypothetical protein